MTLSISATKRNQFQKTAQIYACITIFCMIFSFIYELFSHQVYSLYMICAFLFPFIGGVIPFAIFSKKNLIHPSLFIRNLNHCGIATLTIGSIMQGILEIYGTTNRLIIIYWITGFSLICLEIILYAIQISHTKR